MSVLIPDLKVYNYLQAGIEKMAWTTTIADFWSDSIKNHFKNCPNIEKEAKRLILSWLAMNQKSYSIKYKETPEEIEKTDLTKFYYISTFTHKKLTAIQMLKYLQCVSYNIEIKPVSEESQNDLNLLERCINELCFSIINQMEDYKKATWMD
jgi:hypothetical protein